MNNISVQILFASLKEANKLINHSKIKFKKINKIFYSSESINVHITGIGKKAIMNWLKSTDIKKFSSSIIIKAGTCAVFDYSVELLKIFIPSFVLYNDNKIIININKIDNYIYDKLKDLIHIKGLITSDKPLSDKKKASEFLKKDIIACDMETFYLAEAFKDFIFLPIMTGTDRGDGFAIKDFFKNIDKASTMLKEFIEKI